MTTLYKLTRADGTTHGGTSWGPGVIHTVGGKPKLCSKTVLHAYRSPLLAVLMDPGQAGFGPEAKMWEAEGEVVIDDGTKVGCQTLTTVREIPLPVVTSAQRIRFAILATKKAYGEPQWTKWADDWLSGENRTAPPATAAAYAAYDAAAYAAYDAAAAAAANAAAYAAYANAAAFAANAAAAAAATSFPTTRAAFAANAAYAAESLGHTGRRRAP